MKQTEGNVDATSPALFKPIGFELRPSLGSAFQPIPIIPKFTTTCGTETELQTKAEQQTTTSDDTKATEIQ